MINVQYGEKIYERIKSRLRGQEGKIVAIELESEDFFVGEDPIQACDRAKKKHPDKQFYLKRIGAKCTFVVGAS